MLYTSLIWQKEVPGWGKWKLPVPTKQRSD